VRAASPRVHGGIGGEATAPANGWGVVAGLLGLVDDCLSVHPSAAALPLR